VVYYGCVKCVKGISTLVDRSPIAVASPLSLAIARQLPQRGEPSNVVV
jgi:hypothetical protein